MTPAAVVEHIPAAVGERAAAGAEHTVVAKDTPAAVKERGAAAAGAEHTVAAKETPVAVVKYTPAAVGERAAVAVVKLAVRERAAAAGA